MDQPGAVGGARHDDLVSLLEEGEAFRCRLYERRVAERVRRDPDDASALDAIVGLLDQARAAYVVGLHDELRARPA